MEVQQVLAVLAVMTLLLLLVLLLCAAEGWAWCVDWERKRSNGPADVGEGGLPAGIVSPKRCG